jgi:hypothetical protein
VDFLSAALLEGPVPVEELREDAKAAGISWRTVERAKADMRVRAMREGGRHGHLVWALPGQDRQPQEDSDGGL